MTLYASWWDASFCGPFEPGEEKLNAVCVSFNFECQFKDKFPDDELMAVDGEKWCEFHAPLEDEGENPTEKGKWKDYCISSRKSRSFVSPP